jgi:hypothetical protein
VYTIVTRQLPIAEPEKNSDYLVSIILHNQDDEFNDALCYAAERVRDFMIYDTSLLENE